MSKTYRVFVNDRGVHDAVPEGFSIAGFLFSIVWALVNKLWLLAVFILVSYVLVANIGPPFVLFFLTLGISIFVGIKGNEMVVDDLKKKGYTEVGSINASGIDDAINIYEHPQVNKSEEAFGEPFIEQSEEPSNEQSEETLNGQSGETSNAQSGATSNEQLEESSNVQSEELSNEQSDGQTDEQAEVQTDEPLKDNEITIYCANCHAPLIIEIKPDEEPDFICPECGVENELTEEDS